MSDSRITVVHLVEARSAGNLGMIKVATSPSEILAESHGIDSEVWFPGGAESVELGVHAATVRQLPSGWRGNKMRFDNDRTIVVTHGCWRWPTRLAAQLRKKGTPWVYTPHGMLEPWSLRQKALKKWLYWNLIERRLANRANLVRATSTPEAKNLGSIFSRVELIPHGVQCPVELPKNGAVGRPTRVLFMARIHAKKGALKLAEAWTRSRLHQRDDFELLIVGQDDGELNSLTQFLGNAASNIRRLDPAYGEERRELLQTCDYFALPSQSEGLPVMLLEAMGAGLIALISDGCNLPAAIDSGAALRLGSEIEEISVALNAILDHSAIDRELFRQAGHSFIREKFSLESTAARQAAIYRSLRAGK